MREIQVFRASMDDYITTTNNIMNQFFKHVKGKTTIRDKDFCLTIIFPYETTQMQDIKKKYE